MRTHYTQCASFVKEECIVQQKAYKKGCTFSLLTCSHCSVFPERYPVSNKQRPFSEIPQKNYFLLLLKDGSLEQDS